MNIPLVFQLVGGMGLFISALVILRHVQRTTISDKYGVMSLGFLAVLFYINMSRNWFSVASVGASALALIAEIGFIAMGISFSVQLTEYSRVRRAAIQDLALLRQQYRALLEKIETADADQTVRTH